uniref:Uncharacterized protein n=1 Tax=Rhizophora mucronata TaxID=61149 RepID=A0A2P2QH71_RHIMU
MCPINYRKSQGLIGYDKKKKLKPSICVKWTPTRLGTRTRTSI